MTTGTENRFGRAVKQTDFKGQVTEFVYDDDVRLAPEDRVNLGRLVEKRLYVDEDAYSDGTYVRATRYHYDSLGRMDQITVRKGDGTIKRTESYEYNDDGQLLTSVQPEGTLHYEYDPITGRQTRTWTGETEATAITDTEYDYDELGRMQTVVSVRQNGQVVPLDQRNTTYTYDAVGNRYSVTLPNGITTTYLYDERNLLDVETITKAGELLASYDYARRFDGMKTRVEETRLESDGSYSTSTTDWTYDGLNRLTSETVLHSLPDRNYTDTFTYDIVGNRIRKDHTGSGGNQQVTYVYNNRDQLTSEAGTGTDVYTSLYTYDDNGSLLTKTRTGQGASTEVYEYSLRNRLIRVTVTVDSQETVTEYRYDTNGNRVYRKIGDQEYRYLVDTNNPTGYTQVVVESSVQTGGQANVTTSYIIGDDVIGQANAAGTQYLGYDGHGSTRLLLKALLDGQLSQAILERYDFGAYGEAQGFIAANASTNLLWTGEWFEQNRDMYHLRFRDYTVTNAQFIQSDSDGQGQRSDPQTLHKYAYTHGNPINGIDPSGHRGIIELAVAMTIISVLLFLAMDTLCEVYLGTKYTHVTFDMQSRWASDVRAAYQNSTVCYQYAVGRATGGEHFDTDAARRKDLLVGVTDDQVRNSPELALVAWDEWFRANSKFDAKVWEPESPAPSGYRKVAVFCGRDDYHAITQDERGNWVGKLGGSGLIDYRTPAEIEAGGWPYGTKKYVGTWIIKRPPRVHLPDAVEYFQYVVGVKSTSNVAWIPFTSQDLAPYDFEAGKQEW